LKKAKEHNISISSFLDIELRRYIAYIEGKNTDYSPNNERQSIVRIDNDNQVKDGKPNNSNPNSKSAERVCSVAWISLGLPEPLTRVRIPADPFSFNGYFVNYIYEKMSFCSISP
jgi:hypothetical protein